jgi:anaerobic selenocysteine-containing dehydrogenase
MITRDSLKLTRRGFVKLGGSAAALAASLESRRLIAMEQSLGSKAYSAVTGAERQAVPFTCLACNIEDGGVAFV